MSLHTKIIVSTLTIISSLILTTSASALDYQSDPITLDFNFGETLNITTSDSSIVIPNLTPGTKSISSSDYVVVVNTNNTTGYTLAATVGCSSGANCYNTKNLVDSNNDDTTTNNFTMIDSATTLTTPGTWGISLDSTADENSTFDTLPLYSSTAKIINQTTSATGTAANGYTGTNNTTMRIGAYATTSQLAGTYTNTINFIAVANTVPMLYMQDLTLSQCQVNVGTNGNSANIGNNITVYDKRDGKDYTVRYINGECWMTQNLRYLGDASSNTGTMTIDNNNSNVANRSITLYSLDSSNTGNFGTYTGHCDTTNSYNYACVYDSGSTSTGVWYNYYAASAGTISTENNSNNAANDICPSNWHLPSGPNTVSGTDINKLVGNTTGGWQNSTAGLTAFGAVAGGVFTDSLAGVNAIGRWWLATAVNTNNSYFLYYNSSNENFYANYYGYRAFGYSIRCVKSE